MSHVSPPARFLTRHFTPKIICSRPSLLSYMFRMDSFAYFFTILVCSHCTLFFSSFYLLPWKFLISPRGLILFSPIQPSPSPAPVQVLSHKTLSDELYNTKFSTQFSRNAHIIYITQMNDPTTFLFKVAQLYFIGNKRMCLCRKVKELQVLPD